MFADELGANDFWYISWALMIEYLVNLFLALLQLFYPNFLGLGVGFLEFLEAQMYNINAEVIKTFLK